MTLHKLNNIHKNITFLKKLKTTKKKERDHILKKCSDKNIQAICECLLPQNILYLKQNKLLSKNTLKVLKQHKKYFSLLLQNKNLKNRKKILQQKGGFLPLIIAAAIKLATIAKIAAASAAAAKIAGVVGGVSKVAGGVITAAKIVKTLKKKKKK